MYVSFSDRKRLNFSPSGVVIATIQTPEISGMTREITCFSLQQCCLFRSLSFLSLPSSASVVLFFLSWEFGLCWIGLCSGRRKLGKGWIVFAISMTWSLSVADSISDRWLDFKKLGIDRQSLVYSSSYSFAGGTVPMSAYGHQMEHEYSSPSLSSRGASGS